MGVNLKGLELASISTLFIKEAEDHVPGASALRQAWHDIKNTDQASVRELLSTYDSPYMTTLKTRIIAAKLIHGEITDWEQLK